MIIRDLHQSSLLIHLFVIQVIVPVAVIRNTKTISMSKIALLLLFLELENVLQGSNISVFLFKNISVFLFKNISVFLFRVLA